MWVFEETKLLFNIGGSPYVDGILKEPFKLDADGMLPIPMQPGLGVELDSEKLRRYAPAATAFFDTTTA